MQNKLLTLARPEIVAMKPYSSARSECMTGSIFLDANENPWNEREYNRYPEPQPEALIAVLSELYQVSPEQLLVTRGSDEGIDLLVRLFCRAGQDRVLLCPPTYGMYQVAAKIQGGGILEIPLLKEADFAFDLSAVLNAWQPDIKLIFLCSPNNPTGNLLDTEALLVLCNQMNNKAIIIVDEAYLEFSASQSLAKHLKVYPNLIVLRTLSKAYGMAALRCGVTLANPCIVQLLKKILAPYPIPKPVVERVTQKLNQNEIQEKIKIIIEEREKLSQFLSQLPFVKTVWKSEANFVLFEAYNYKNILQTCFSKGLVLRDRSSEYNLKNCIRVTVGEPTENKFLREVLNRV